MNTWSYLFIGCCAAVFFNYLGYALIAWLVNRFSPSRNTIVPDTSFYPGVSFIVAAYNEADCIEAKILNSLSQQYPADKLELIFITDGSTDGTPEQVRAYSQVRSLHEPARQGKSAALNRAVAAASHEILIFSDANTLLNPDATFRITRHYADQRVGGVAGEKSVVSPGNEEGATQSEGIYWKYESALKKIDSDFYSVVGAAGELFSVRKDLYEPVSPQIILDDFIISMKVAIKGYRVRYEPGAVARELPSFSIRDEKKRKIRIAAGGFQAMQLLPGALRFWKHFRLTYLYLSHRVLRWTLSPLALLGALISNGVLLAQNPSILHMLLLAGQVLFYGMGIAASLLPEEKTPKLFRICYYFLFMNWCVVLGFFRFLRGQQSAVWEKARRMQPGMAEEPTAG
jgi:biofilm PGA synthesis N-glycosyltransferase PgaC